MPDEGTEKLKSPEEQQAPPPAEADKPGPDLEVTVYRAVVKALGRYAPFAVTGLGTALLIVALLSEVLQPPLKWAVVAFGILLAVGRYAWRLLRGGGDPQARSSLDLALAGAIGLVIGLVVGLLGRPVVDPMFALLSGECDDPVELSVLMPVDGAFGFSAAVVDFNEHYVDGSGCKRANVTAYSAPWPDVRKALELGWEADPELDQSDPLHGFEPLLDVGPRPDLLLTESASQTELAEDLLDASGADGVLDAGLADPIGSTPLVVAVPGPVFEAEFGVSDQVVEAELPALVDRLREEYGLPVVRSDPSASFTALRFLDYLYERDVEADAVGTKMENQLARSVEEAGLALPGTDTDLICDVASTLGADPEVAVLTTERALSRYNSGEPLGENCPLRDDPRSDLMPVYLQGTGELRYQSAHLAWDDPWAERRAEVASALTEWLAGAGDWSPEDFGVRGVDYSGGKLDGDVRFELGFDPSDDRLAAADHETLLRAYGENRVPTNVLLAIDGSLSMGTQIDGEGRSRFELATEGVRTALGYLGPRDQAGVWAFPAEGGPAYTEILPVDAGRTPSDADRLASYELVKGVDLNETLVAGIDELDSGAGDDSVEAMVVLTDGADRDESGIQVAEVSERVASSGVSLYLIAVGDASCRAEHFSEMTESPRITCLEAEEDQIESAFDTLFRQLWGGDER